MHGLREQEGRGQVDVEHRLPVGAGYDVERPVARPARQVHDVIEAAELAERLRHAGADRRLVGDVETLGRKPRLAAGNGREREIGREHGHASRAQQRHRGAAEATGRTRDEGHLLRRRRCARRITAPGVHRDLRPPCCAPGAS
jgi:hypothetical protein